MNKVSTRPPLLAAVFATILMFALLVAFTGTLAVGLSSCAPASKSGIPPHSNKGYAGSYEDFIGVDARIGSEAGDIYAQLAREIFYASEAPTYQSVDAALDALLQGDTDAVLVSGGFVRHLLRGNRSGSFSYIDVPPDVFINESGPIFHTTELRDEYNLWFAEANADGLWDAMVKRWLQGALPVGDDIPHFELTGEAGILRVGDTGNYPPLSYEDDELGIIGFDYEMINRFASARGYDLEIVQRPYEDIIPLVVAGEVDMSACTYSTLAIREQELIFGEPGVFMQSVLVIPRQGTRQALQLKELK